jgi:hypothetical protein
MGAGRSVPAGRHSPKKLETVIADQMFTSIFKSAVFVASNIAEKTSQGSLFTERSYKRGCGKYHFAEC